jgi:hypothetical protein
MKKALSLLACAAWIGSLPGCSRAPVVVPAESLTFPVVLVVGTRPTLFVAHVARVVVDAEDLGHMRSELYSGLSDTEATDPPIVIDAGARIADMTGIKGAHGGLWMMAHPTGMMPITFTLLQRKEQGVEAARALIADSQFIGPDLDQERRQLRSERIRQATNMAEIVAIVNEMPGQDAAAASPN